ncbi:MAG: 16S rRNA (uracil(1498)-N(3))-methyltransferase [Colwellia sp.]
MSKPKSQTRIYQDIDFSQASPIKLDDDAFGHIVRVLRLKEGDYITLFNGKEKFEHLASLVDVSKKQASIQLHSKHAVENESPLNIHLGQGISRGDRMDFTLQKSVELGVNTITPLFTQRCGVKLTGERLEKKTAQWQKIVISACEQSGRCIVPIVQAPLYLDEWLEQESEALKLNLHPKAQHSIMNLPFENNAVRLLIGPEGGLNDEEILQANTQGFQDVLLGPRILRTETAALTAITALQCRYGDLN